MMKLQIAQMKVGIASSYEPAAPRLGLHDAPGQRNLAC
jgi:hypothetical protein